MKNKDGWTQVLQEMREDNALKQKNGLHFIITSVFIWLAIFLIHHLNVPILTKNFLTLCCSAPLVPLAYAISRLIKVDFQNKENPLTMLGIIVSVNQMLYILIAMWVYASVPDKMVMVYAMIFGAHLLPYGWLYQSRAYYVFSVLIPVLVLSVGISHNAGVIAAMMILVEIILCVLLGVEVRTQKSNRK